MTRSVSEISLMSNAPQIPIENSQIVLHDEDENSNVLDVSEYCSNREVVNLENANVNVDNSTDVIFGPVTQFNVNGNVTIYSNGSNSPSEAVNRTIINQEERQASPEYADAKLANYEKTDSEEQDVKALNRHKKIIRILVLISFFLLLSIGITVLIMHYTQNVFNDDADFTPTDPGGIDLNGHHIFEKSDWGGRPPKSYVNITSPVPMVIIKHTGGGTCSSFQICAGKVQTIQSQCVSSRYPDIVYSFLIGGDGNIYVGRGWDVQPNQRSDTIDIAFMGSFAFDTLNQTMIEAALLLLQDGVNKKKLTEDYKLVAHNQTMRTESPGSSVFNEIRNWEHYDGELYFGEALVNTPLTKN